MLQIWIRPTFCHISTLVIWNVFEESETLQYDINVRKALNLVKVTEITFVPDFLAETPIPNFIGMCRVVSEIKHAYLRNLNIMRSFHVLCTKYMKWKCSFSHIHKHNSRKACLRGVQLRHQIYVPAALTLQINTLYRLDMKLCDTQNSCGESGDEKNVPLSGIDLRSF
jgi:hypothetical protein